MGRQQLWWIWLKLGVREVSTCSRHHIDAYTVDLEAPVPAGVAALAYLEYQDG